MREKESLLPALRAVLPPPVVLPEPPPESLGVEEAAFLPESNDDTKGSVILWAPFDR